MIERRERGGERRREDEFSYYSDELRCVEEEREEEVLVGSEKERERERERETERKKERTDGEGLRKKEEKKCW